MLNKPQKGDIEPKADSHETQKNNPQSLPDQTVVPTPAGTPPPSVPLLDDQQVATVNVVLDGIEYPELADRAKAMKHLDNLLVQNEARGTSYELALGLQAKQVKAMLKSKRLKGKKLNTAFDGYMGSLKLSAARSTRTIQRYIQVVEEMTEDGTLTDKIRDALKAANFSEDIQTEVLQLTDGKGITKLYEKYGMVTEKQPRVKVEKTLEERLMDEVAALMNTYKSLTDIRSKMIAAGEAVDASIDEMLTKVFDAAVALSKVPLVAEMLKKLEDKLKAEGAAA